MIIEMPLKKANGLRSILQPMRVICKGEECQHTATEATAMCSRNCV